MAMSIANPSVVSRRKLNRRQVQEILERNIKLYKDEESLVPYLVDLAIYLLEYEYDWDNSGVEAPEGLPDDPEVEEGGIVLKNDNQVYKSINNTTIHEGQEYDCPHCGSRISEELVCPNCRNLTR